MSREDRPAPVYPENSERHLAQTWGEIRDITEQLFALVNIDVTPESYNNVTWFAPVVSKKHASLFKRVKSITDDAGGWTPKRTNASEYDKPRPKRKPRTPVENLDIAEIRSALDAIPNDDVHYDEWLKIGMCLHDTGAGEGLELWDDWSQKSHKYREGMCDEKWDTFSDDDGKKNRVLSSRKSNPSGIPLAGRILGVGHGGWGYALLALYRQNRNPLCRSCHSPQQTPLRVACRFQCDPRPYRPSRHRADHEDAELDLSLPCSARRIPRIPRGARRPSGATQRRNGTQFKAEFRLRQRLARTSADRRVD